MKSFIIFSMILLSMTGNFLLAEDSVIFSNIKDWEHLEKIPALVSLKNEIIKSKEKTIEARVYGCYFRSKNKNLAEERAMLIKNYLSTQLGVTVTYFGVEQGKHGVQARIVYDFQIKKSETKKTFLGLTIPKKLDNPLAKLIAGFLFVFIFAIFLIIIIKKINRSSKTRQIKKDLKEKHRHEKWLIREENKQKSWKSEQERIMRAKRKKEIELEEKARAKEAERQNKKILAEEKLKITQEKRRLENELEKHKLKAKEKELDARRRAEQEKELQNIKLWPKTVAEIRSLEKTGNINKDEERLCPHCIAELQDKTDSGKISQEEMLKQISYLPKIKFQNILRHFGRTHPFSENSNNEPIDLKQKVTSN